MMTAQRDIAVALSGILLAILLGALDATIVTPALPVMAVEFKGLDHLSWVVVAYLLTSTAMTLVYGKLSDIYGRGRMILIAIVLFVAASVLCASARTLVELVAARALQGIGGGGLIVMAQAMIADFIPPRERGRFQVYVASVWAVASIAGPSVGGWFVDHLSWRWVFWINVPLGLIAFALCRRAAARLRVEHVETPIDYAGAVLLSAAVTGFLLVMTWGGITYPWTSGVIAGTLAASVAVLAAFVAVERRAAEPLLPPRIYGHAVVIVSNLVGLIVAMLAFAAIVLFPVYFELVMGFDAGNAGVLLIPFQAGITVASFSAGQIMRKTGRYKWMPPVSLCGAVAGCLLLATIDAATPPLVTMLYSTLMGLGIGATFPVLLIATQNAAEPRDLGVATSTIAFSRQLGASFGAAIFWSIILGVMAGDLHGSGMDAARRALFSGGRAAIDVLPAAERTAIVGALVHGFHVAFACAAAVSLAGLLLSLLLKEEPLSATPRMIVPNVQGRVRR
jgi:EmrB/QacA subfamily drug resistance transporter